MPYPFTRGDKGAHGQGGSEAVCGWLWWYAFAGREWTVHGVISEGDKAIVRNPGWVAYGGVLLGVPSEGQRVLETGILILRVEDRPVREHCPEMGDLQLVT